MKVRSLLLVIILLMVSNCGNDSNNANPVPGEDPQKTIDQKELDLAALSREASRQEIVEGSLIKGNIDFSESTIQYYTTGKSPDSYAVYPKESSPLTIVDHAPEGELPVEMRRPTIYVMFNHPMVPLAKLGEPITETPLMKIEPAVPGVYRWYGTKLLSFQPNDTLVDNPRYTVTVSQDAKSLGGNRLGNPYTFEFHTETVKMVNFYAGNNPDQVESEYQVPVKVGRYMIAEFNQPVDTDHLRKFLQVSTSTAGTMRDGDWSISHPAYPQRLATRTPRAVLVTLNQDPPENVTVNLTLKDKASPKSGYPERSGDQTSGFHTVTPFTLQRLEAYSYDMPRNNKPGAIPVYLEFSHPVDAKAVKETLTCKINAKPVKPVAIDAFGSTLRINLMGLNPEDTVAISAPATVKDIYGRPLSNPGYFATTQIPKPWPLLDFPSGFHHLEAAFPPGFIWAGRNLLELKIGSGSADHFDYDLDSPKLANPVAQPFNISDWRPNRVNYRLFDLKPLLNSKGFGTAYLRVEAKTQSTVYWDEADYSAIQVTDLGITTRYAYNKVLVWVHSLSSGKPVEGASVGLSQTFNTPQKAAVTDKAGFVDIPLQPGEFPRLFSGYPGYYLGISVSRGPDRADLLASNTMNTYGSSIISHDSPVRIENPVSRIMIFTDRGLYKPGEELALRGIHWIQDPAGYTPYKGSFKLILTDPRSGEKLWEMSDTTTESGGFATRFMLPKDLEPGSYTIRYSSDGPGIYRSNHDDEYRQSAVSFTVAQFRRLAFQVNCAVPPRSFFAGDEVSVETSASYLAGGAMPQAGYSYYWTRKPVPFTPPGNEWANHVFGPGTWEGEQTLNSGNGKLGGGGKANISVKTLGQNAPGAAYDYRLETTVQDIDRQAITSGAKATVHPASFYIGARFSSGSTKGWWSRFVSTGTDIPLDMALVQPDGRSWKNSTKLTARILKGEWKAVDQQGVYGRINTRWEYVETEVSHQDIDSRDGKADWKFKVADAGDYLVSVEGKDSQGRVAKTVLRFYATGSSWVRRATETPSDIDMICDKDLYYPGDTAHILVRSPIQEGSYLLTVEREGIFEEKIVTLKGGQSMIEVPVLDKYTPVFYVALTSFTKREAAPKDYDEPDLGRPRGLFGITGLRVSTKPIELDVTVEPVEGAYRPGTSAEVLIKVSKDGKPVANAEVTALAVDRGVLDLINYHVPDPVDFFYNAYNFPLAVHGDDSRRLLMKPVSYDTNKLTGGGDSFKERSDFRPLALFEPYVRTDSKGEARVSFKLPDSLTTYRVTALALKDSQVGIKENELLVQNPVNVRAALPRRFRNRDTAAAGVILQNLTKTTQKVEVTAESDILTVGGAKTRSIEIPPNGVYELPFILSASSPGEGTITFVVRSAVVNEKLIEKVLVEKPLVKEAFATIGTIAKEASTATEGLIIPSRMAPGFGGLEFLASSTMKPRIEGAVQSLHSIIYPYPSFYSSLLYSFASVYAPEKDSARFISNLMKDLKTRQQPDGGIFTGSYSSRQPYIPDAYISLLTAHFLEYARDRNHSLEAVPDLGKLLGYLKNQKAKMDWYGPYYHAYNNYVLAAGGKPDKDYLAATEKYEDKLGLGGYGLLTQAYLAQGDKNAAERVYKRSKNFVMIGTQSIDLKETYEVTNYWSSEVAEIAMLMKNAFELGEDKEFVQRVAGALKRGDRYWRSSNDDLWTLLGFLPILDAEGPAQGAADMKVTLGTSPLFDFKLSAGEPEQKSSLEFSSAVLKDAKRDVLGTLNLQKSGDSPVYWTMIMTYALPNETAIARDEGIEVNVRYETLDGVLTKEKDLKLGETYRVQADVSTTKRRQRLELQVPVPNGVEIIDPTFVTSGKFKDKGGSNSDTIHRETVYGDSEDVVAEGYAEWNDDDWYWYYYQPDVFALDNMMVYRWTDFYAGSRTVTFLVRVTTPGIYPTPPAAASLEFEPEVFGRSEGKLFVIKP